MKLAFFFASEGLVIGVSELVKLGAKIAICGRVINPKFVSEYIQVGKNAVEFVSVRPPRPNRQPRKLAILEKLVADFAIGFNENLTAPFRLPFL